MANLANTIKITLTAAALSLQAFSATALTVVEGYAPLALTANSKPAGSNFDTTASLNGIVSYHSDSPTPNCSSGHYDSEACMAGYGITHIDVGPSDKALKVTGALGAPTIMGYGRITWLFPSSGEVTKIAMANGLIPGTIAEASGTTSPGVLPLAAQSFSTSVDFKTTPDATGQDYRQSISLGTARVEIRNPPTGDDTITFVTPISVAGSAITVALQEDELPALTNDFPENTWLTYSVSYDATNGSLTHTLESRDDGGILLNESLTVNNVFPHLLAQPMIAVVDVVEWSEGDVYGSAITLDNYVNSQNHLYYTINFSPLSYDKGQGLEDYISTDGYNLFSFNLIDNGAGNYTPSYMFPIFMDGYELPAQVNGAIGNNLHIGLVSIPNGAGGWNKITVVLNASREVFEAYTTANGAIPDAYFPDVYVANGSGNDYLIPSNTPATPGQVCATTPLFLLSFSGLIGFIRRRLLKGLCKVK